MADPIEKVQREIAAETYRSMALRLRIQAALETAQAEALEQAAERIASGRADVDTLRLAEELPESETAERPSDQEIERERWRGRRLRVLEAVVAAAARPASDLEAAGWNRLQEAAGFHPDEEQDFGNAVRDLMAAGLVEQHRVPHPNGGSAPFIACLPTLEGFEEVGCQPPGGLIGTAVPTIFEHVGQPTQKLAVADGAEAGDH